MTHPTIATRAITPRATPTPIPAHAPALRPPDELELGDADGFELDEDVDVLEADVLVGVGVDAYFGHPVTGKEATRRRADGAGA